MVAHPDMTQKRGRGAAQPRTHLPALHDLSRVQKQIEQEEPIDPQVAVPYPFNVEAFRQYAAAALTGAITRIDLHPPKDVLENCLKLAKIMLDEETRFIREQQLS